MPLFVRVGHLQLRTWFGVVDNLAVDVVFGMFIDCCIWVIFSTEKSSSGIFDR